jgi:hypothetical protein
MRCVGNPIVLEESFLTSECADRADAFKRECESKAALNPRAYIELTHFEAQSVAVRIIANLRDRALEK